MNGLLRRLTRRRAATADEPPPGTPAASEPVDATVVSQEEGPALSEEERAREEELRRRRRDLPAGLEADRLEAPLGEGARRGAIRRRIRFLQAAREVLLRDLGGFTYEVHRAGGASHAGHRDITERKAQRLSAIDEELRAHEAALGIGGPAATVVRQPGIGGTCPSCGELHGSDAGWCAYCGTPLTDHARTLADEGVDRAIADRAAAERERAAATQATATTAAEEPTAESRRALAEYRSRHAAQPEPSEQPTQVEQRTQADRPAAPEAHAAAAADDAEPAGAPEEPAAHEKPARRGRRSKPDAKAPEDQPTTDLGEPVASEQRK
jgi:hypothetical protein